MAEWRNRFVGVWRHFLELLIDQLLAGSSVKIDGPRDPLYVGSYRQLRVRLGGIQFEGVEFENPAGLGAR